MSSHPRIKKEESREEGEIVEIEILDDEDEPERKRVKTEDATTNDLVIDADLKNVYNELDVSELSQRRLSEGGVTDVTTLLMNKDDLLAGNLKPVKKRTQDVLYKFCVWRDDFEKNYPPGTRWQEVFNEDACTEFLKKQADKPTAESTVVDLATPPPASNSVHQLYEFIKSKIHSKNFGLDDSQRLPDGSLGKVCEHAAKLAVEMLPLEFKGACQFCPLEFANVFVKNILGVSNDNEDLNKAIIVWGKTQSGKSRVKGFLARIGRQLNVPVITITKGVQEKYDLEKKMEEMLYEKEEYVIEKFLRANGKSGGTLKVVADTAAQIDKATKSITQIRSELPDAKFIVIFDECDSMYRTAERKQKMEQAVDKLLRCRPVLRLEVSATPLPALLSLVNANNSVQMLRIGTHEDYSGIEQMKSLQDTEGNDVFLENVRTSHRRGVDYCWEDGNLIVVDPNALFPNGVADDEPTEYFPTCENLDFIPYAEETHILLYDDAMSGKRSVLLLDGTASRVGAHLNIFDKAACIQNRYRSQGKDMVIVVCVGRGIFVRRPGYLQGRHTRNTVSEVLEHLDKEFGPDMPIFVFGYTKMRRCVSYRSKYRVSTHMVLMIGNGHSNENFIQAIARATFNGRNSILQANGHQHVTVLTSYNDLQMAKKYSNYLKEVMVRLNKGHTTVEAIQGTNEKFPDAANFLRHTNRKVGQVKQLKGACPPSAAFENPDPADLSDFSHKAWRCDVKTQRVLKAIQDFLTEEETDCFAVDDIVDMYNGTYQDGESQGNGELLRSPELRKILTVLKNDAILEKVESLEVRMDLWKPKSVEALSFLVGTFVFN